MKFVIYSALTVLAGVRGDFGEEERFCRANRDLLDLERLLVLRRERDHDELIPAVKVVSAGRRSEKAKGFGRIFGVRNRDARGCAHLHPSPRRRLQVERHPEAIFETILRHARILKPPQLDPVPSQSPASERKTRHAQSRIEPTNDGSRRVGREERQHKAVMVEAQVAIESDEVGRSVDRADFPAAQILSQG